MCTNTFGDNEIQFAYLPQSVTQLHIISINVHPVTQTQTCTLQIHLAPIARCSLAILHGLLTVNYSDFIRHLMNY